MTRDLDRRLARLESATPRAEPTVICADRWMTEEDGAEALRDWRRLVSSGEASVDGCVLFLLGPELSEAEWVASHVTLH